MCAGAPDFFFREAKRLNYVARSAFKLLEIQKKHGIIRRGAAVLDLGCAPGAWLQVVCQSLGPPETGGAVVGVDVKVLDFYTDWLSFRVFGRCCLQQKVKVPTHHCDQRVQTIPANVLKICPQELAKISPSGSGFGVILSDMCPAVSGISSRDAALSTELGLRTLNLALPSNIIKNSEEDFDSTIQEGNGLLLAGGSVVIKLLEGEDSKELVQLCKPAFKSVVLLRPRATRSSSREIYLIAKHRC